MNFYVLKSIEFGPAVFRRLCDRIDPSKFDLRTSPDRFSLREAMAHLADWEPIFRGRIENVLKLPGFQIVVEDESVRAAQNSYETQSIDVSLATFARERAMTAALVRSLTPEQLELHGVHEAHGQMSVEDLANLLVCHDMYHVDHVAGLL